MKSHAKTLIKNLTNLGFNHIWTNTSGHRCYAHPADPDQTEILVNPSTNEASQRNLIRRAQKLAGALPTIDKRRATQIKDRAAADRERARTLLTQARDKQQRLTAARANRTLMAQALELVARRERELAALEHLMQQAPDGGNTHRGTGQARHQTGGRT